MEYISFMQIFLKILCVSTWAFAFLVFFETFPKSSQERWIDDLKGLSIIVGVIVTILVLPPISQKDFQKVKKIISNTIWILALYLSIKFLGAAEALFAYRGTKSSFECIALLLPILTLLAFAISRTISTIKNRQVNF